MSHTLHKAVLESSLSVDLAEGHAIRRKEADLLFEYFKNNPIYRWADRNNNCENRANAICIMLDKWKIANNKGWVFSGAFLKNENGYLINYWKYHVAALVRVEENGVVESYIIDPATSDKLETIQNWSNNITDIAHNYYFITDGDVYIYHPVIIKKDNWFKRNKQNYKWTIQGLAGINGVSSVGKAQLCFCKARIKRIEKMFRAITRHRPEFLR